ncbi:Os01g0216150 [Oryza sativa Japonica Group]|uniref:Os01g0216150 protein n=1 Tax=Oryza sativa subsp. japonica TaxID=39947 RepID=A0A0P0UZR5_ORYSJ|nr:hypothetical protein EE612_001052 [Oryza sativa]BAS71027.1 Os01g0216150 [Oryza sativa Japonica Group]
MAEVLRLAMVRGEQGDSKALSCACKIDVEAAIGGAAGGVAEEGLAVGEVVERDAGEHRRRQLDEVAGVGVRVAEAEDGVDLGTV